MEDGDGVKVSSCSSGVEKRSSSPMEVEDSDSSKPAFVRESSHSGSDHSQPLKYFLGFNNVNGDCAEKDIEQDESALVGSSPNNSFSSESSDATQDSSQDDVARAEADSSSDNSSKSSCSDSSQKNPFLNYLSSKSGENSSLKDDIGLPDSSSDSDSSDSEDSIDGECSKEETRVETPDSHSIQSAHGFDEKEESKSIDFSSAAENGNSKTIESPLAVNDNISDLEPDVTKSQLSPVELCGVSEESTPEVDKTVFVPDGNQITNNEQVPLEDSPKDVIKMEAAEQEVNNPLQMSDTNNIISDVSKNMETSLSIGDSVIPKPDATEEHSDDKEPRSNVTSLDEVDKEITEEINSMKEKVVQNDPEKIMQQTAEDLPKVDNFEKSSVKPPGKINKTTRRKTEEKSNPPETFSFQYKGQREIGNNIKAKKFRKSVLKWNPFNPTHKKDLKTGKYILQKSCRDDIDCSSLQPEYAQYLGLQPRVKFKCSNCGISNFQTMSALHTHQVECKKNGKSISETSDNGPAPDVNSANIKFTRKVFLCSKCGTYYHRCDLFLHMREFHRRYICLFCLYMGHSSESLMEHLQGKHNVVAQEYSSLEELMKKASPSFYLLCETCDRVFTALDYSPAHKCTPKNSTESDHNQLKRPRADDCLQMFPNDFPCHSNDFPNMKALKLNKEISMKPVSNTSSSDTCSFLNPNESSNNHSQVMNDNRLAHSSENSVNTNAIENNPIPHPENLQIKVPSGIEIKPLIPGENNNQENKFERTGIEIFPINSERQKPSKKPRTVLRTIKKKKSKGKVKFANKGNYSITPIPEENETIDEPFAPPISPPIIAPPPVVTDSNFGAISLVPKTDHPVTHEPELPEPQAQTEPEPQVEPEPSAEEALHSPPSTVDERSESPIQPEPEHRSDTPEPKDILEPKTSVPQDIFKIKLPGDLESDAESDDSQKLSLIVDENTNNSDDSKKYSVSDEMERCGSSSAINSENLQSDKMDSNDIPLAREDIAAMALTLDDKIENVPIQAVVKECVRTSCLSCNYCKHAVKIAVNGKQLALHLLSEHRYTPVKNETNEDVVRKLKNSLEILQEMYFNTETYDSSDPSLHIPYDKESNFDCFQCSYVSSSHKDLYAHKRKCHTKSLLLCIMCKKNFFSYSELICHICAGTYNAESQVYSVDINFRCCFCRLDTIPSAFRLMVHLRKSHHTCDICLEMCSDQQKLSTHMWKHKLSHLCYRCGIAYASKPDITKHLFWKHGTESVLCKKCLQKKWPHVYHFCIPPTSFICEECNTSFSKAVALKVHKRIHGNDYPYSCPQCEKKFVSKKLLARHIDRHNAIFQKKDSPHTSEKDKDEIINVTDVVDSKEASQNDNNKEDGKDKCHKKHKKEKDKKEKKVLDVYDLPPLNLSSESDSSDDESSKKTYSKVPADSNALANCQESTVSDKAMGADMPKLDGMIEDDTFGDKTGSFLNLLKPDGSGDESDRKPTASEPVSPFDSSVVNSLLPLGKDEIRNEPSDSMQNEQVEGIWENFYKTNPQNSNLPFPLCAMKSDLAYNIIMGDHDYCSVKVEPVIKEDLPSTSNLDASLSDDKLEEISPLKPENPQTPPPAKEDDSPTTPPSVSKKKVKSPKKKALKTPDDNNSSSSSDSSSDSDSSCSCGTNCSCCSSSSSSSSSSSDSDSSTTEDKKLDKRKKRKEKKIHPKSDGETELPKEVRAPEPEIVPLPLPEDPPIRESELETDESTSDEEFYDRQPQVIANQLLAEKRQMMQLASGAGNSDTALAAAPLPQATLPSLPPPPPTPLPQAQENIPPPNVVEAPKQKQRAKRKRKANIPKIAKHEKPLLDSNFPKYPNELKSPSFGTLFMQTPPVSKQKSSLPVSQSPSQPEASGSGSETDSTRLSKRRRVPNKFYGYSSGDDEEKQQPKWRKSDGHLTHNQTPKLAPIIAPPPTPRIQLTVPKQIIRKPYNKQPPKAKVHSSTDSSDSGTSDVDDRVPRPQAQPEPVKADKVVYCYCRCPYDEVSEMIACDDVNCKIEWFHFECVGILVPPRGQWYCPGCRKARGLPT